ncbi:MAG: tRNA pseudouridine(55) synthase TruB [Pseudomonadota bacterium]
MTNKRGQPINGWINLNKPLHVTSAGAVNKVKWLLKPQKIGHAGTLDPLATGVLPLALGEGTKCVNLLMDAKKTYEFAVTFGERRATEDAEGEVIATSDHRPDAASIIAILPRFTGDISQLPPIYSALKVDGKRAYDLARAGEAVVLEPRPVTVHALEFLGLTGEVAEFRAIVSKGTYIRSLGRDIAQALGSEGYISRLHRAAVGPFTDTDAISLDFLEESVHNAGQSGGERPWLTPLTRALDDIPALTLEREQLHQLRHGQRVTLTTPMPDAPLIAVLHTGELQGLARVEGNQVISVRLLNL